MYWTWLRCYDYYLENERGIIRMKIFFKSAFIFLVSTLSGAIIATLIAVYSMEIFQLLNIDPFDKTMKAAPYFKLSTVFFYFIPYSLIHFLFNLIKKTFFRTSSLNVQLIVSFCLLLVLVLGFAKITLHEETVFYRSLLGSLFMIGIPMFFTELFANRLKRKYIHKK
jgi:hypothetical protein